MAKDHPNQVIANHGQTPVTKAAIIATQKLGQVARGEALADLAIAEAKAQGTIWTRYYRDMFDLDIDGRKAFRSRVEKHLKEMGAYVKEAGGRDAAPAHAKAWASAKTRLGELSTITKAMDAGVSFDKAWPYHYAYGVAKAGLRAEGMGSNRGPKPKPALDKIKAFLEKNVPAGQWDTVAEMVATMAKVHNTDAPV